MKLCFPIIPRGASPKPNRRTVQDWFIRIFIAWAILYGISSEASGEGLYARFTQPDPTARPFMYWYWNGNRVTEKEVIREIGIMKEAGFGGFAIFSIGTVHDSVPGFEPLLWGGQEWCEVVKAACLEARRLGMQADLVMSAGWPFGGQFLKPEQYIQRVVTESIPIRGDGVVTKTVAELMALNQTVRRQKNNAKATTESLRFVRLIPDEVNRVTDIIVLDDSITSDGIIKIPLRKGIGYRLVWGIGQRGYRTIVNGTPGISGPALDHFNRQAVLQYLEKIDEIERRIGIPFRELFRALRCDSIELEDANWSDDFARSFREAYGYDLETWYPFVFYDIGAKYLPAESIGGKLGEQIKRVRFDFNRFVADRFHTAFTQTVRDYCASKGVPFCFQAYGHPSLIAMPEGYLIPEIPEGNTWLFSYSVPGHEKPVYDEESYWWNRDHGYMIWNKYAAAGGHLTGRRIISCEAVTNNRQNYDEALEDIKQSCDMTMITGITHLMGHIYNYSPLEVPFPGWVRYTTYFSERNTWWKYIGRWSDYSARLSSVLMSSCAVTDVGIISAEYDVWAKEGFSRSAFQRNPEYIFHLWEQLANIGSTCDYLSQGVLDRAFNTACEPILHFPYKVLVLGDVRSITGRTADIIEAFVRRGGKLVFAGNVPDRTVSILESNGDRRIKSRMKKLLDVYPGQVVFMPAPGKLTTIEWVREMMKSVGEEPRLKIHNPVNYAYQAQYENDRRHIYFFNNSNRVRDVRLEVEFPRSDLHPWIWDPHTGGRTPLPVDRGIAMIEMEPIGSKLIVFDETPHPANPQKETLYIPREPYMVAAAWDVAFIPVVEKPFNRKMPALTEFTTDPQLVSFSGDAVYRCTFTVGEEDYRRLDLGEVNRGVTSVKLNGVDLGMRWYGRHEYELCGALRRGDNELEIRYTNLVKNYVITIPKAQRPYSIDPTMTPSRTGLMGPVILK